jgi:hypothetical protein
MFFLQNRVPQKNRFLINYISETNKRIFKQFSEIILTEWVLKLARDPVCGRGLFACTPSINTRRYSRGAVERTPRYDQGARVVVRTTSAELSPVPFQTEDTRTVLGPAVSTGCCGFVTILRCATATTFQPS